MKSKYLREINFPISKETYCELLSGLKTGKYKWRFFSKELKNALHNFEESERTRTY